MHRTGMRFPLRGNLLTCCLNNISENVKFNTKRTTSNFITTALNPVYLNWKIALHSRTLNVSKRFWFCSIWIMNNTTSTACHPCATFVILIIISEDGGRSSVLGTEDGHCSSRQRMESMLFQVSTKSKCSSVRNMWCKISRANRSITCNDGP